MTCVQPPLCHVTVKARSTYFFVTKVHRVWGSQSLAPFSPSGTTPDLSVQQGGEVGGALLSCPGHVQEVKVQPKVIVPRIASNGTSAGETETTTIPTSQAGKHICNRTAKMFPP